MNVRRWLVGLVVAVCMAVGLFGFGGSAPVGAQTAPPEPIVFVHGWNSSPATWNTMRNRFTASGFPANRLFAFGYNTSQSNTITATQFNTYLDQVRAQTGSPVVDVVTHSMGALGARWCMRGPCNGKV